MTHDPKRTVEEHERWGDREAGKTRAYEKPGIAWEELLEVRAALSMACAKSNPGEPGPCFGQPPAS